MRAFVVFAILGVALGRELCRNVKNSEINKVLSSVRTGAILFLGVSCPSFDIDRVVFRNKECRDLVRQATCYGIKAAELYNVEVVNYARLRSDMPNMESLGNLACEKTHACVKEVKKALKVCIEHNVEFLSDTIASVESFFKGIAWGGERSLFDDLGNMAMQQFSSADIRSFIELQLTDAMKSEEEAPTLVQEWCDSGCTRETGRFLSRLFRKMHGGQCTDASVFCGACATRADKFFERTALPCCLDKVVQKGIELYGEVVENYEGGYGLAIFGRYADAIRAELSQEINLSLLVHLGLGLSYGQGFNSKSLKYIDHEIMKDILEEEFDCVKHVYLDNRPVCE